VVLVDGAEEVEVVTAAEVDVVDWLLGLAGEDEQEARAAAVNTDKATAVGRGKRTAPV
jgi:hypothetical protein